MRKTMILTFLFLNYSTLFGSDKNFNKKNPEGKKLFYRQDTRVYTKKNSKQQSEDFSHIPEEYEEENKDNLTEKPLFPTREIDKNFPSAEVINNNFTALHNKILFTIQELHEIKNNLNAAKLYEKRTFKDLCLINNELIEIKSKIKYKDQNIKRNIEKIKIDIKKLKTSWWDNVARICCCCFIPDFSEEA